MNVQASIGSNVTSFFDAVGSFFDSLARVGWLSLLIGAVAFVVYLTLRSRAFFHTLRAAYPGERIQFRRIWGAYIAAYGFNNVIPARGGDVIKLFLVKRSIPGATYPAVGAAICVEAVFDAFMAIFILGFAFSQGVFPKPPDFAKVNAFDLSFFAGHPKFLLFVLTALAIIVLVGFALLSQRVKAFWARVRQGLAILFDRPRYLREVFAWQLAGWCFRFTSFWFLLDAFNVGGSVRNVLLVLGVNAIAAIVPFTPGGAGVQQALLVKVFSHAASGATVAAYSVGQQIVIAVTTLATGFGALVTIFRIRSFKEAIRLGKEEREAEKAAEREAAAGRV
ncbi:MAG TPA: lysylphosphatidylglycerol synthase transmembrane domain-containing protein [Solirubrobacteraceae bacterium]|nr:lysylphosphatidylglycerol synthase transmembrane domain-containing protein [Solirubrobacteraceae bacterium]